MAQRSLSKIFSSFKTLTFNQDYIKVLGLLEEGNVKGASEVLDKSIKIKNKKVIIENEIFDLSAEDDDELETIGFQIIKAFSKNKVDSRDWSKLNQKEKHDALVDFVSRNNSNNKKRNLRVLEENVLAKDYNKKVIYNNGEIVSISGLTIFPNGDFSFEANTTIPQSVTWKPCVENTYLFTYFKTIINRDTN